MDLAETTPAHLEILGVPISAIGQRQAIDLIGDWIGQRQHQKNTTKSRYVCACNALSVTRARGSETYMRAIKGAEITVADGTLLVWISRLRGEKGVERVSSSKLLNALCARSVKEGWSHYFYGGAEGVAGKLALGLSARFEGLNVAGTSCPQRRLMTPEEIERDINRINASGADIVWIGIGSPEQEIWMLENRGRLEGRIVIGVQTAFDIDFGGMEPTPVWMRDNAPQWMHRLITGPRRLWRRHFAYVPSFVALSLTETLSVFGRRALAQFSDRF